MMYANLNDNKGKITKKYKLILFWSKLTSYRMQSYTCMNVDSQYRYSQYEILSLIRMPRESSLDSEVQLTSERKLTHTTAQEN